VILGERCNSAGIFGRDLSNEEAQDRFVARASAAIDAVEAAAIEKEFMGGDVLGSQPHLANGDADILTVSATNVVNGLGLLENAIGETGKAGVIRWRAAVADLQRDTRCRRRRLHRRFDAGWRVRRDRIARVDLCDGADRGSEVSSDRPAGRSERGADPGHEHRGVPGRALRRGRLGRRASGDGFGRSVPGGVLMKHSVNPAGVTGNFDRKESSDGR
jgi:hypothetical protein